ncbi:MAG TPA: hypothetical protein VFV10_17790 [Gammaproteobacteria bacterium]|nr:hypothetical protein [Gammaproteobacteria bacterium]
MARLSRSTSLAAALVAIAALPAAAQRKPAGEENAVGGNGVASVGQNAAPGVRRNADPGARTSAAPEAGVHLNAIGRKPSDRSAAAEGAASEDLAKDAVTENAAAQDRDASPAPDAPRRCISLPRLEKTDVVDDRTIVFHMRDGRIYMNHLSRDCPGLEREKRFMYSPTSSQLCEIDGVTVIEKWAFGFTRGFTCSLGEFHPLTSAEFDALMRPVQAADSGAAQKTSKP